MPENSLQVINDVECYEKDSVVYLKLEAVARGLGFTETAASGNEVVKWSRVKKYLADMNFIDTSVDGLGKDGFSQEVGKDGFIPENIFYRLAMKAKNETAEKFQALVADEIIPSIRRTGGYQAKPMTPTELMKLQVQVNEDFERRQREQEEKLTQVDQRSADTARIVETMAETLTAPPPDKETWQEATNRRINQIVEENGLNHQTYRHDLYKRLENSAGVNLELRQQRMKKRMKTAGATIAEIKEVTKLHIISRDRKLRVIFDSILTRDSVGRVC